ncbi:MAG: glycosyltransferase family 9 protein [bacterium]
MNELERRLKRAAIRVMAGLSSDHKLDFREIDVDSIKRILLVKRHELGDFLLFSPVLPAVRRRFPDAYIAVCTRGYTKDIVTGDPLVDDVLVVHESLRDWRVKDLSRAVASFAPGFDLAVVFNIISRSFTSEMVALLSRARYRIGPADPTFPGIRSNPFCNLEVPIPPERKHMSERCLSILEPLGISMEEAAERMYVGRGWEDEAASVLMRWGVRKQDMLFGIHPGGARVHNRWPMERYAALADRLSSLPNGKAIVVIGRGERCGDEVARRMAAEPIICDITNIRLLAAVFKQLRIYVGNDTGLLHVAAAVGTRAVGIYGKTDPDVWKPKGSHVIAVRSEDLNINSIDLDTVYEAVLDML